MLRQEESGGRGTRSSGEARTKPGWDGRRGARDMSRRGKTGCPGGPARPCALLMSCRFVSHRTACTGSRCWRVQKQVDRPVETPYALSRSIPDQQLAKTQQPPLTSVHLLCYWKLFVTLSMTSLLPPICIRGLRLVFTHLFCSPFSLVSPILIELFT